MKQRNILKTVLITVFALSLLTGSALAAMAPINPAFTSSVEKAGELNTKSIDNSNYKGGRTPSPVDLSHLAGQRFYPDGVKTSSKSVFAVAYDLRDYGYVTSVKDQDPYGACWTFSPMASLESTYLKAGGSGTPDYSEQFTGYYGYVDQSSTLRGFGDYDSSDFPDIMNFGGDDFKATALLARWTGIVNESDAPYGSTAPSASAPVARHLQDVYYFYYDSDTRYQPASVENIKQALTTYGAVSIGMYAGDPLGGKWDDSAYFNSTTFASYIPSDNPDGLSVGSANHAVTVVGWDDNYSKTNFNLLNRPSSDGAWIVKNSWGSDWGDGGYFYLSYEDAAMDTGAAYVSEASDNYDSIYQYDIFGWCNSYAPEEMEDNTAWFANVFTTKNDETLKAVSFYAGGVNNNYEIKVYRNAIEGPTSGTLIHSQNGIIASPGYHTVKISGAIDFYENQTFSVVVKLKTPGYTFPVALEFPIKNYSDKAVASAGQSYLSANGADWTDTVTLYANTNACLKAFTGTATPKDTGSILVDIDPATAIFNGAYWTLDGTIYSADIGVENISPDTYKVAFKEIDDWYTPDSHNITVTAGNLLTITGNYVAKASVSGGTETTQSLASSDNVNTAANSVKPYLTNMTEAIESLMNVTTYGTFEVDPYGFNSMELISSTVTSGEKLTITIKTDSSKTDGWVKTTVPMLYNYSTGTYDLVTTSSSVSETKAASGSLSFDIEEGSDYDGDSTDGKLTTRILNLAVRGQENAPVNLGGSGCSIGYAPSILLLILPLILLKK